MTDVDHPVIATTKIVSDKFLWSCVTTDCNVCTFYTVKDSTDIAIVACGVCHQPAAKLRDPLPKHVQKPYV